MPFKLYKISLSNLDGLAFYVVFFMFTSWVLISMFTLRSDCVDILTHCGDITRFTEGQTPERICDLLSPTDDPERCIPLHKYLSESLVFLDLSWSFSLYVHDVILYVKPLWFPQLPALSKTSLRRWSIPVIPTRVPATICVKWTGRAVTQDKTACLTSASLVLGFGFTSLVFHSLSGCGVF